MTHSLSEEGACPSQRKGSDMSESEEGDHFIMLKEDAKQAISARWSGQCSIRYTCAKWMVWWYERRKGNQIQTILEVHWSTVPRGVSILAKSVSPHAVSNHGPFHYEWNALPLSYMGKAHIRSVVTHNRFTIWNTILMHPIWGSNPRPHG